MSKGKKVLFALLSVGILAFGFIAGYFVSSAESDGDLRWAIGVLQNYAAVYDEDTGEYRAFTEEECIKAIVSGLADRYSAYYTREEFEDFTQTSRGNYYGVGISYEEVVSDGAKRVRAVKASMNSPIEIAAREAGIEIAGKLVRASADENGENETSITDAKSFSAALQKYAAGVRFRLYFEGVTQPVVVAREAYVASYVRCYDNGGTLYIYYDTSAKKVVSRYAAGEYPESADIASLPADTAYIKFDEFTGNAATEFGIAMAYISEHIGANAKLILDMRYNGGGDLAILTQIASYFINAERGATVAIAKFRDGGTERFVTGVSRYQSLGKVVVLANENSASATECLIGALVYYGALDPEENFIVTSNAYVAGAINKTYGKGIMQSIFASIRGTGLKVTTAHIYWPDGTTNIHGKGIAATAENSCAYENAFALALTKVQ